MHERAVFEVANRLIGAADDALILPDRSVPRSTSHLQCRPSQAGTSLCCPARPQIRPRRPACRPACRRGRRPMVTARNLRCGSAWFSRTVSAMIGIDSTLVLRVGDDLRRRREIRSRVVGRVEQLDRDLIVDGLVGRRAVVVVPARGSALHGAVGDLGHPAEKRWCRGTRRAGRRPNRRPGCARRRSRRP